MEMTLETLQRLGRAVGFDAIGATSADPFPELKPHLEAYTNRGRTGFEHEHVNDRIDPRRLLPSAKSLIAVAMAYLTEPGKALSRRHPKTGQHGVVTVYSYGADYHKVMQRKMLTLVEKMEAHLGRTVNYKVTVDTSPLVDRRVAERAGIGWVGKNCMFFTPQHGSFVFLGTLLVDVEVEPAVAEVASQCGSCQLCLDACPTGALIAPGVIDARRCLSYVTQMKGIIPEEYRALLGRRVWGCDTCQWACPVNKDVDHAAHEEYLPQGELAFPDLVDLLQLSNREFTRRYGHTAAAWRGVRTWQRNALIALGNCRNPSAVPHILPFLTNPREELRASAAWALKRIGGEDAFTATRQAFARETADVVRREMAWAVDDSTGRGGVTGES